MKHLTLFELTDAITDIVDDLVDALIAGDTEEVDSLLDELDSLYERRSEKHEGYIHVIKNADSVAKACKEQANAFYARAKALENLSRRLKDTLLADLEQHGETRTDAGNFKIARQNGQPRVVVHVEASELPQDYQRVTIEADKTALKDALKHGEAIDGVALEPTEHIRIRVK